MAALDGSAGVEQRLVHTAQHYDRAMSGVFFEEMDLPVLQAAFEGTLSPILDGHVSVCGYLGHGRLLLDVWPVRVSRADRCEVERRFANSVPALC
jgi:hypothetical protein